MPKEKSPVRYGRAKKSFRRRHSYDFDKLKVPGESYFIVPGKAGFAKESSIRAQASKQGKARKVRYSVSRTSDGIVVKLEAYLP